MEKKHKGEVRITIKNEKTWGTVWPIINASFQYFQRGIHNLNRLERFKYIRQHKMDSFFMAAALQTGGKELLEVGPDIYAGNILLNIDILKRGGVLIFEQYANTKTKLMEMMDSTGTNISTQVQSHLNIEKKVIR